LKPPPAGRWSQLTETTSSILIQLLEHWKGRTQVATLIVFHKKDSVDGTI